MSANQNFPTDGEIVKAVGLIYQKKENWVGAEDLIDHFQTGTQAAYLGRITGMGERGEIAVDRVGPGRHNKTLFAPKGTKPLGTPCLYEIDKSVRAVLEEFIPAYFRVHIHNKNSKEATEGKIRLLFKGLLSKDVTTLTTNDLKEHLDKMCDHKNVTDGTLKTYKRYILAFFKVAELMGVVEYNPAVGLMPANFRWGKVKELTLSAPGPAPAPLVGRGGQVERKVPTLFECPHCGQGVVIALWVGLKLPKAAPLPDQVPA